MPKLKTNKSILKRVKITGRGKVMRLRAGGSHLLSGKSRKRRRRFRRWVEQKGAFAKTIKTLLRLPTKEKEKTAGSSQ